MSDTFDPFRLVTGLKDDYDAVIVGAYFGPSDTNDDVWYLFLAKKDETEPEPQIDRYGLGNGWASFDGGETVAHAKNTYFNNNSGIGELITATFAAGAEDVLRERSASLENIGPRAAALWLGLKCHWMVKSETFKMKDRDSGEMVERTRSVSLPSSFMGVEGVEGMESPTPAAAPAVTGNYTTILAEYEPALVTKLKIAAKTKSYPDFVDEALTLTEGQGSILNVLGDEDFYKSLKG